MTFTLAALCVAATALPEAAGAQAGAAPGLISGATAGQAEPTQCIHRTTDDRPSTDPDAKRLTVWLSVRQPALATIKASGSAMGLPTGTLSIVLLRDGIPLVFSQESRGHDILYAYTGATLPLAADRQYQITAKPKMHNKTLTRFTMDVAVGGTCP